MIKEIQSDIGNNAVVIGIFQRRKSTHREFKRKISF